MCLIVIAYRCHPDYPLIIVANRDEFYARPSTPMHLWPATNLLAGQDLQAGGTWLGLNRRGQLAMLTNYRDGRTASSDHSRGQLPLDFLTGSWDAGAYQQHIHKTDALFAGYNLISADATGIYYHSNRSPQQPARSQSLAPGIYGLSNALLDTPWPKVLTGKRRLQQALQQTIRLNALSQVLADPTAAADEQLPATGISYEWEKRLSACFIVSPEYGTRAVSVIRQHRSGRVDVLEQSFAAAGYTGERLFQWQIPVIGGVCA